MIFFRKDSNLHLVFDITTVEKTLLLLLSSLLLLLLLLLLLSLLSLLLLLVVVVVVVIVVVVVVVVISSFGVVSRLLPQSGLWQHPRTRVVMFGGRKDINVLFQHSALRNTLHVLYITHGLIISYNGRKTTENFISKLYLFILVLQKFNSYKPYSINFAR